MERRPTTFRPPLEPEHHGPAIVHLQLCSEDHEERLGRIEASQATLKRWGERALWTGTMGALFAANLTNDRAADLLAKLLLALFAG